MATKANLKIDQGTDYLTSVTLTDDDGVAIRAGHHCCQILHDKLGIPATARASIGVYNDKEDMDKLSDSIKNCQKVFQN